MANSDLGPLVSIHRPRRSYLALLLAAVAFCFGAAAIVAIVAKAPLTKALGSIAYAAIGAVVLRGLLASARTHVELREYGMVHRLGSVETCIRFADVKALELRDRSGVVHTACLFLEGAKPLIVTHVLTDFRELLAAFHRAGMHAKKRDF
jgi:hypothetical protein